MYSLIKQVPILALVVGLAVATAHAELPVVPFQARYSVYGYGLPIGEALLTLSPVATNGYAMRFDVQPNPLVALLASHRIQEQVSGTIQNGRVLPQHYERQIDADKKSQKVKLDFDWATAQVKAHSNTERATLPLSPGATDPLSLNLAVMQDLQRGSLPDQYTLIDGTESRIFHIRNEGEEVLDTRLGPLRTLRVRQARPDGKRTTLFWFAAQLRYLPVQITRQKDGREDLRLEIHTFNPAAP